MTMHIRARCLMFMAGTALAFVAPAPVHAQETQAAQAGAGVGDIVVTAQRRSESIQQVPIAVSAMSSSTLQQRGLTNVAQISAYTPNVDIKNTASFAGSSQILVASIRGIGQNDFAFNLEPGVGVYIDGVYFARSLGAVVDLLDLERVEVLKGPQGDLFGRNTIGGALNIVTRDPSTDFHYQLEATTGRFSRTDVRGSVDVPLVQDKLLSQFSFSVKRRDGYQKRIPFPGAAGTVSDLGGFITAGPPGGSDTQGGENVVNLRGKLKWVGSDSFKLLISGDYTRANQETRPSTLLKTFAGPTDQTAMAVYNGCIFGLAPPFLCSNRAVVGTSFFGVNVDADPNNNRLPISDAFVTGNKDTTYARGSNYDDLTSWGLSGTAEWSATDKLTVKSITAYRKLSSKFGSEIAAMPILGNDASFVMKQKQFSQELQLSHSGLDDRLKSVIGLYYFSESGSLLDLPVIAEGLIQVFGPNSFKNKAYAAFAHENFAITDHLGLTFGVRATREKKRFEGMQHELNSFFLRSRGIDPNGPIPPAILPILPDPSDITRLYPMGVNHQTFSNVSFRAGVDYKFSRDVMAYYSFSQGFKSGGWTTRLLDVISPPNDVSQLTFRPEKANTHEIGLKSTPFDRHLRLNLAAFTTDYTDIQVTQFNGISPVFKNAGKATIKGFEAEAQAKIGDLSLSGSLGHLDAYYRSLDAGVTFPVTNRLVNTPKWSASFGANYDLVLASSARISLAGDYTYKSNSSPDAENSPYLQSGKVGLLNGSISYNAPEDRWGVTFGVHNITDKRFVVGGFDQSGAGQIGYVAAAYNPPRQWYLTLRVKN